MGRPHRSSRTRARACIGYIVEQQVRTRKAGVRHAISYDGREVHQGVERVERGNRIGLRSGSDEYEARGELVGSGVVETAHLVLRHAQRAVVTSR